MARDPFNGYLKKPTEAERALFDAAAKFGYSSSLQATEEQLEPLRIAAGLSRESVARDKNENRANRVYNDAYLCGSNLARALNPGYRIREPHDEPMSYDAARSKLETSRAQRRQQTTMR